VEGTTRAGVLSSHASPERRGGEALQWRPRVTGVRQTAEAPSTEETRREGVGLAWLLACGCPDEACRHAARPGHHGAVACRRLQWDSAEAVGDGTEASSACPQMAAPAGGAGWGGSRRPDRRSLARRGPESASAAGGWNRGGVRRIGEKP
jgi:hypothetical protein